MVVFTVPFGSVSTRAISLVPCPAQRRIYTALRLLREKSQLMAVVVPLNN